MTDPQNRDERVVIDRMFVWPSLLSDREHVTLRGAGLDEVPVPATPDMIAPDMTPLD